VRRNTPFGSDETGWNSSVSAAPRDDYSRALVRAASPFVNSRCDDECAGAKRTDGAFWRGFDAVRSLDAERVVAGRDPDP
jgi:hypothetical protein